MSDHRIRPGQVYVACTDEDRRIRVVGEPMAIPGVWGYGKVAVETLTADGRGIRRRGIEVNQLHASATTRTGETRRSGYRLVTDTPT